MSRELMGPEDYSSERENREHKIIGRRGAKSHDPRRDTKSARTDRERDRGTDR